MEPPPALEDSSCTWPGERHIASASASPSTCGRTDAEAADLDELIRWESEITYEHRKGREFDAVSLERSDSSTLKGAAPVEETVEMEQPKNEDNERYKKEWEGMAGALSVTRPKETCHLFALPFQVCSLLLDFLPRRAPGRIVMLARTDCFEGREWIL